MKKAKLFKILLSATSITTLSASSFGLVSCSNKNTKLWNKFKDSAQHESALNIIKSTNSKQWLNPQKDNLTLSDFDINEKTKTVEVKITNLVPYSIATFTIKYHKDDKYNAAHWVCNNDYNFQFSTVKSFPTTVPGKTPGTTINNNINQIVEIDHVLYIGSNGGLFESSDGKKFIQNTTINDAVWLIKKINTTIYLGTLYGLYQSNDDGKTFSQNKTVNPIDIPSKITMINNKIYVGTNSSGLYCSSNDGKDFARIDSASDLIPHQKNLYYPTNVIEEINHNIYIGSKNIFISKDDGKTFKKQYSFSYINTITKIIYINGVFYIGTSIDNKDYEGTHLNSGLYTSTDMCKTCRKVNIVGYYNVVDIINSNNDILVAVQNANSVDHNTKTENGIYLSHDGKNFTQVLKNSEKGEWHYINRIKEINNVLYVFADNKYYSSVDNQTFTNYSGNNYSFSNGGSFNNVTYICDAAYLYVNQKLT